MTVVGNFQHLVLARLARQHALSRVPSVGKNTDGRTKLKVTKAASQLGVRPAQQDAAAAFDAMCPGLHYM